MAATIIDSQIVVAQTLAEINALGSDDGILDTQIAWVSDTQAFYSPGTINAGTTSWNLASSLEAVLSAGNTTGSTPIVLSGGGVSSGAITSASGQDVLIQASDVSGGNGGGVSLVTGAGGADIGGDFSITTGDSTGDRGGNITFALGASNESFGTNEILFDGDSRCTGDLDVASLVRVNQAGVGSGFIVCNSADGTIGSFQLSKTGVSSVTQLEMTASNVTRLVGGLTSTAVQPGMIVETPGGTNTGGDLTIRTGATTGGFDSGNILISTGGAPGATGGDVRVTSGINLSRGVFAVTSLNMIVEDDGDIFNTNGTYGTLSDARLKENVTPARGYLEDLATLNVVNYNLIGKDPVDDRLLGLVAQEVEQVFPKLVQETDLDVDDQGTKAKGIKASVLAYMMLKAIQELKVENDTLKARVDALENP